MPGAKKKIRLSLKVNILILRRKLENEETSRNGTDLDRSQGSRVPLWRLEQASAALMLRSNIQGRTDAER